MSTTRKKQFTEKQIDRALKKVAIAAAKANYVWPDVASQGRAEHDLFTKVFMLIRKTGHDKYYREEMAWLIKRLGS